MMKMLDGWRKLDYVWLVMILLMAIEIMILHW